MRMHETHWNGPISKARTIWLKTFAWNVNWCISQFHVKLYPQSRKSTSALLLWLLLWRGIGDYFGDINGSTIQKSIDTSAYQHNRKQLTHILLTNMSNSLQCMHANGVTYFHGAFESYQREREGDLHTKNHRFPRHRVPSNSNKFMHFDTSSFEKPFLRNSSIDVAPFHPQKHLL